MTQQQPSQPFQDVQMARSTLISNWSPHPHHLPIFIQFHKMDRLNGVSRPVSQLNGAAGYGFTSPVHIEKETSSIAFEPLGEAVRVS